MSREDYIASTKGGTDKAAVKAISDRAQNQGTRQSSFDSKSGTSGSANTSRYWQKEEDEAWESKVQKGDKNIYAQLKDTYHSPRQVYNKAPEGSRKQWTHELMGYNPRIGGLKLNDLLAGLGDETLKFWGVNKNSQSIPVELYQQLLEGSIVGGMESLQSKEKGIGTWSDLEKGVHSLFPGGTKQYYGDMALNRYTPAGPTFPEFPGGGGGGYGGYGRGGGGSGGGGGGYSFNEYAQQGIAQPPGVGPGTLQEQVSQGFLSGMGAPRFSRGGIVSLLRLGE